MKKQKNAPQILPREEWPYEVPENWVWIPLLNAFINKTDSQRKLQQKDYLSHGVYPVIDQGKNLISGYTNDDEMIYDDELPIIIFGDHTRCIKYVDFSFAQGADGVKVLCPKKFWNPKLFYFALQNLNILSLGYRRHFPTFNRYFLPLPPLPEQQRIVARIESLFSKLDAAAEKIRSALGAFPTRKAALLHKAFTGELTKKWREEHGVGMDGWKEQTLQDVCSMKITDGTHQTPTYCTAEEGIPFISSKDVTQGYIDWRHIKYIVPSLHEELYKRLAPQKDDVLLAKNGTTGIAAIVDVDKVFDIYVTLAVLRPNKEQIIPSYLLHIVNSPACKQQFDEHLTGIGLPNLHLRDIKAVLITVPTLPEQKEVVRILDAIFKREQKVKEVAERLLEKIALTKKAILARAFRGLLGTNDPKEESAEGWLEEKNLQSET